MHTYQNKGGCKAEEVEKRNSAKSKFFRDFNSIGTEIRRGNSIKTSINNGKITPQHSPPVRMSYLFWTFATCECPITTGRSPIYCDDLLLLDIRI
uniref:Uncharacterized protein n=1 Tax=Megaselia scalaris TaxID=36166 RepID=T1H2E6_MEGSC